MSIPLSTLLWSTLKSGVNRESNQKLHLLRFTAAHRKIWGTFRKICPEKWKAFNVWKGVQLRTWEFASIVKLSWTSSKNFQSNKIASEINKAYTFETCGIDFWDTFHIPSSLLLLYHKTVVEEFTLWKEYQCRPVPGQERAKEQWIQTKLVFKHSWFNLKNFLKQWLRDVDF